MIDLTVELPEHPPFIGASADQHLHDTIYVDGAVEWWLKKARSYPRAPWFLGGDAAGYIDLRDRRQSMEDAKDMKLTVAEQLSAVKNYVGELCDIVKPYPVFLNMGNHEDALFSNLGDSYKIWEQEIPNLHYIGWQGRVKLVSPNGRTFRVLSAHGLKDRSFPYARARGMHLRSKQEKQKEAFRDMMGSIDGGRSHLYLCGHYHQSLAVPPDVMEQYDYDTGSRRVTKRLQPYTTHPIWTVAVPSFTNVYIAGKKKTYTEAAGYRETPTGFVRINLSDKLRPWAGDNWCDVVEFEGKEVE